MTAEQRAPVPGSLGPIARYERSVIDRINDFNNPRQKWRRLFSELLGTRLRARPCGLYAQERPDMTSRYPSGSTMVTPHSSQ
jgi:aquaporin Z